MFTINEFCNQIKNDLNIASLENKKILITGATGRIGAPLIEVLLYLNSKYKMNMKIVGVARSVTKVNSVFGQQNLDNIEFICSDINTQIEYDGNVDIIFHFAGPAAPNDYKNGPVDTLWSHTNGTHNMLEFARKHATKRFFYISTVEVYGDWKSTNKVSETDMGVMNHLNFRACYPEAKRLCETMVLSYEKQYGICYSIVRLSHTIGPKIDLYDGRAFAEFIQCAKNNSNIVLNSLGLAERPYTYVLDAIKSFFYVLLKSENRVFNIANNNNVVSINNLAKLVVKIANERFNRNIRVVSEVRDTGVPYLNYNLAIMNTQEIEKLGWIPNYNLEDTLFLTMKSFMEKDNGTI